MNKKMLFIFFSLASILLILIFSIYGIKKHFTPIYSGSIQFSSLFSPGKVFFDNYGIPHIESENRSDLYKMFGYTVAQDRLFQIQLQKMIASGRLSEWFGAKTIDTDTTIRTIGVKHYTSEWFKRNQSKMNPQLIEDLNSWLEGVNECVKNCPKPLELVLLKKEAEPVSIEDVLAFSGLMSFSFSKAYYVDAISTKLYKILNSADFEDFIGEKIENEKKSAFLLSPQIQSKSIVQLDSQKLLPHLDGSQSWVLSPNKSASGFATLANDPHIAFSNPGVWYEAHLKSNRFELYGYFIPIIPFALIGNNTQKAWSLTMSYSDEIDLLSTDNESEFHPRIETILVRNDKPIDLIVKDTSLGPVINHLLKDNQNAIMSWDYYREDNFVIETFFELAEAETLPQFHQAVKKGRAPGLNVSWADKNGNIAWRILGYFPKRDEPHWKTRKLSSKDSDFHDNLNNSVDDKIIPQIENPKSGYILSANQKPPFPYDEKKINGYWEANERFDALENVIKSNDKITLDTQKKMFVLNVFSGAEARLKKMLLSIKTDSEITSELNKWDGLANFENKAQGFYLAWIDEIAKTILKENLNETELEQLCSTSSYWKFITRIIDNPSSGWWKNKFTETLQFTFTSTVIQFKNDYGPIDKWNWGHLHQVTYEHPLGKVPGLNKIFNLGPYPIDGGYLVPNAFRHKLCTRKFNVTGGASTRRLVDFKNPTETLGILPTGNSGVLFSPHYDDQVELYLTGQLREQTLDWSKIKNLKNVLYFNN